MNPIASPPPPVSLVAVTPASIAVVIAGRDAGDHVAETLQSLVDQSRTPDQIVFFDDGSKDDTRDIVESFREELPMLTVIGVPSSVGISNARNRAAAEVSAEFIAVLDADDLLATDALMNYAALVERDPSIDLVYGDSFVFAGNPDQGATMRYPAFANRKEAMRKVLASPILPLKHSSILMRRSTLEGLGGYDETFPIKVDVELFLRFLNTGKKVRKLDRTISFHRKHGRQISTKRIAGLRAYRRLFRLYEPNFFLRPLLFGARAASEMLKCLVRG